MNHDGKSVPNLSTSRLKSTANSRPHWWDGTSRIPPNKWAGRTLSQSRSTFGWICGSPLRVQRERGIRGYGRETPSMTHSLCRKTTVALGAGIGRDIYAHAVAAQIGAPRGARRRGGSGSSDSSCRPCRRSTPALARLIGGQLQFGWSRRRAHRACSRWSADGCGARVGGRLRAGNGHSVVHRTP